MIKYYCDCCGKEAGKLFRFEYYAHLDPSGKWVGYEYKDEPIAYRTEVKEMCLPCYNIIIRKAVSEFIKNGRKHGCWAAEMYDHYCKKEK